MGVQQQTRTRAVEGLATLAAQQVLVTLLPCLVAEAETQGTQVLPEQMLFLLQQ
jgi:hypothetical protein